MFAFPSEQFTVSFVPNQFRSTNRPYSLKAGERDKSKI